MPASASFANLLCLCSRLSEHWLWTTVLTSIQWDGNEERVRGKKDGTNVCSHEGQEMVIIRMCSPNCSSSLGLKAVTKRIRWRNRDEDQVSYHRVWRREAKRRGHDARVHKRWRTASCETMRRKQITVSHSVSSSQRSLWLKYVSVFREPFSLLNLRMSKNLVCFKY